MRLRQSHFRNFVDLTDESFYVLISIYFWSMFLRCVSFNFGMYTLYFQIEVFCN